MSSAREKERHDAPPQSLESSCNQTRHMMHPASGSRVVVVAAVGTHAVVTYVGVVVEAAVGTHAVVTYVGVVVVAAVGTHAVAACEIALSVYECGKIQFAAVKE